MWMVKLLWGKHLSYVFNTINYGLTVWSLNYHLRNSLWLYCLTMYIYSGADPENFSRRGPTLSKKKPITHTWKQWVHGLLPISSGTIRENTNRWYLLKYPIFHVEILCEYTLRNTKLCVWISVQMNMYLWCYMKNRGIQYRISRPGPWFNTHFTNTHVHFTSKHKSWIEETN